MSKNQKSPSIVLIGGGTGSFALLSNLKDYIQDITALVNMVDSGGSTGQLRDEFGVLPTGDVRQCLVALSRSSQEVRDLFNFRFDEGSFEGHSFGNIFLATVQKMTNSFDEAVSLAGEILSVQGQVIPITLQDTNLVYIDKKGKEHVGEGTLHKQRIAHKNPKFKLRPEARINPKARDAIKQADLVVIAPGNLYESLKPALMVKGVKQALEKSNARLIYVCNLMNDSLQTKDYRVDDFVRELEEHLGKDTIDVVIYNKKKPSRRLLSKYSKKGDTPVAFSKKDNPKRTFQPIAADVFSRKVTDPVKGDKIKRTYIRHDGDRVAREIMKVFFSE